ncbi:MAG TPA: hypothetical protein VFS01_04810, partial [Rhizomicrobium sp.]|nr:hypothetical protein [Rhizomicrobium sp.]
MRRGSWALVGAAIPEILKWLADWLAGRELDSFTNNPERWMHGAAAMIAPHADFLTGVSVGMLIALIIGYWERIIERLNYWRVWMAHFIWLIWNCR